MIGAEHFSDSSFNETFKFHRESFYFLLMNTKMFLNFVTKLVIYILLRREQSLRIIKIEEIKCFKEDVAKL